MMEVEKISWYVCDECDKKVKGKERRIDPNKLVDSKENTTTVPKGWIEFYLSFVEENRDNIVCSITCAKKLIEKRIKESTEHIIQGLSELE